jgi:phage-related tail fiber protein
MRESGSARTATPTSQIGLTPPLQGWEAEGKTTRRNWWDTLSGGTEGRPYTVDGKEFPVLAAAQRRQGKPVTSNAIQRNARETPPPVRETGRWPAR